MAYVVRRPGGRWELRESRATVSGPRSRTLATFGELTPDVVERARRRSSSELTAAEVRQAAARAGAPIATDPVARASAELLRHLSPASQPPPAHRRLLRNALAPSQDPPTDAERAVAPWIGVDLEVRGEALRELLLLADRIPKPGRRSGPAFPKLDSGRH